MSFGCFGCQTFSRFLQEHIPSAGWRKESFTFLVPKCPGGAFTFSALCQLPHSEAAQKAFQTLAVKPSRTLTALTHQTPTHWLTSSESLLTCERMCSLGLPNIRKWAPLGAVWCFTPAVSRVQKLTLVHQNWLNKSEREIWGIISNKYE